MSLLQPNPSVSTALTDMESVWSSLKLRAHPVLSDYAADLWGCWFEFKQYGVYFFESEDSAEGKILCKCRCRNV